MSIRPARIRAIVVAVLVLAFIIPWTYAHIAYAWPWKEQSTGEACTGRYYLTPYDKQRSIFLGILSDGQKVRMSSRGGSLHGARHRLFQYRRCQRQRTLQLPRGAEDLHLGDTTTIEGVGTFTLKEAHSDIVWFTPTPGKATFCFDPDPTFTFRDFP